jgi:predicted RNA-binding Zn ribbon-like protein
MLISEALMLLTASDPTPGKYGGRLSLGLANVATWARVSGEDLLDDPAELAAWLGRAHAATPEEVEALSAAGTSDPEGTAAAVARLRELAEALRDVFDARLAHAAPSRDALDVIGEHVAEALRGARLEAGDGMFALDLPAPGSSLDAARLAAARSAASVLGSRTDLAHLKRCPREDCQFAFVDDSRNQTRRWCDTRLCGNRARVARHYARTRDARSGA